MKNCIVIPSDRFLSTSFRPGRVFQFLLHVVTTVAQDSVGVARAGTLRRAMQLVPALLVLFGLLACMLAPEGLQAADPPSYTFKPKNESGDPAKGWYIHLPPPFTANDVLIKDSGGKILKKVRVIDRGQRTGVTVLFETDGAGVPDKAMDELKLTLTKPLGKTGASGFRDKDGVKGVPVGEVTWDPIWTDNKGGTGGTKPKEEKKPQQAPSDEEEVNLVVGVEIMHPVSDFEVADGDEGNIEGDESGTMYGNNYPYTSEETSDELFGDWVDGDEWDAAAGEDEPFLSEDGVGQGRALEPVLE